MSSRLDLTPADLDRLEDALEDLELSSALDEAQDDDPVAQRLSEYREILRIGREAMPLEEVPAGLLDGVLAEARQAAAAAPAATAAAPSFWAKWRLGLWVPALAFAGSAALLLVVLVPKGEAPSTGSVVADAAPQSKKEEAKADAKAPAGADERLAFAEPAAAVEPDHEFAEGEGLRGGGVAIGERAPEPEPAPPAEEQAASPADDAEAPEVAQRRKAATAGKQAPPAPTSSGSKPTPKPSGAPAKSKPDPQSGEEKRDASKDAKPTEDERADDELWAELARADADRSGGNCGLAKMRYDKLRKLDDARLRARALAGAGLCAAAGDDMGTAKKLFAQARSADPDVSSFIDRELARIEDGRANAAEQRTAAD